MDDNGRTFRLERKLPIVVAVVAALLFAALLLAERDSGAATLRSRAAAAQAAALAVPDAAQPATPISLPAGSNPLAVGQQVADTAAAQAVFPAATTGDVVCPTLLADRAAVVAQFAALLTQFPAQSAALIAQRTAALAPIDAQLRAFGCTVPSGP